MKKEIFNKYIEYLSVDAKELIERGYLIKNVVNFKLLEDIKSNVLSILKSTLQCDCKLENLHEIININELNDVRIKIFKTLNSDQNFRNIYYELAREYIDELVGTELASNRTINFSIQLPEDKTSLLPIHSDTFSGESEFQINLWIPLTDCYGTNSMYIFNPKYSKKINENLQIYEQNGLTSLLDDAKEEYKFLSVNYGQMVIFTPTCLHGNTINKTNSTRISFNCRFKNLYSPCNLNMESEKKTGSFYMPLSVKAASIIGIQNSLD